MPICGPVVCFRWFPFLWSFLICAPAKSSFPGERAFSACYLRLVEPVRLRDVMDICVMAVKCMGQAAVRVAVCKCEEWLQMLYFSAVASDELCWDGMGWDCAVSLHYLPCKSPWSLLLASSFFWQLSCFQRDSSGHSYSNVFVWLKQLVLNHHMYISGPGILLWHKKSITLLA